MSALGTGAEFPGEIECKGVNTTVVGRSRKSQPFSLGLCRTKFTVRVEPCEASLAFQPAQGERRVFQNEHCCENLCPSS
jgi:hypothetical protein